MQAWDRNDGTGLLFDFKSTGTTFDLMDIHDEGALHKRSGSDTFPQIYVLKERQRLMSQARCKRGAALAWERRASIAAEPWEKHRNKQAEQEKRHQALNKKTGYVVL